MSDPQADSLIGTRIREYEILEIIGRGGMGAVYKARHVYLDEERAIKLIHTQLGERASLINRFIREAKILTKLKHPNLVQLYEFGTLDEKQFFMVLEFLSGESVLQRIKRNGRIPAEEAIHIIREAALGLELAHQKDVIHRDISPDNLLLVRDDTEGEIVKVIDFGIAKPTVEETKKYTMENMFLGKLEYSSPEQCGFLEQGERIDYRTDVYSLGVTLYHMVSGKLPFTAPTPQGYMVKHASEIPQAVSSILPPEELPAGLDELIMAMLAKKRSDRPASMREVVEAFDRIAARQSAIQSSAAKTSANIEFSAGHLFAQRYLIEQKIGRGGMGIVYRATDTMLGVTVALKLIHPSMNENPNSLERFKREVILARRVAHRNVCRIYDFGENDGVHYVSMEYLQGRTLAEELHSQGAYSVDRGIPILLQILRALEEAHDAGVVHRDLKPQNIIVDENDRACITDFGISTSVGISRLTQTGALIGTPRYMAPEQFGERTVDHRVDIYSMGIIMFEMFTGNLPYEANTPASVMYAHLNAAPQRPSVFVPDIGRDLEAIILRSLEKDPNKRFGSVTELIDVLEPLWKPLRKDMKDMTWTRRPDAFKAPPAVTEQAPRVSSPGATVATKPAPPVAPPPAVDRAPKPPAPDAGPRMETTVPGKSNASRIPVLAGAGAVVLLLIGGLIWFIFSGSDAEKPATPPAQQTQQAAVPEPATEKPQPPPPVKTEVAPAAPTAKEIKIDTAPAGASILVDGKDSGLKTPASLSLQLDQPSKVELKLEGYQPAERDVDADSASVLLVQLAPLPGSIGFKGKYAVSIYEGNKLLGKASDGSSIPLEPRVYNLTLLNNSGVFIRDRRQVEVKPGQTTLVNGPEMGTLSITANPSNCKIYIDGVYIDSPPIFDFPVQSGQRNITVKWETLGKEKSNSFAVEPGKSITLRAITDNETTDLFQSK